MSLRIHFLRHGQSEYSRENRVAGAGSDIPLSSDGHKMAAEFAAAYSQYPWRAIYCSPLIRTRQTIEPLLNLSRKSAQYRSELREIEMGAWEGMFLSDVKDKFQSEYHAWETTPTISSPPGGETALEVAARSRIIINEIKQSFNSGDVLLVTHKATIRIALCDLLGIDLNNFRHRLACPVCSISTVEFGSYGAQLLRVADRNFMSKSLQELEGT